MVQQAPAETSAEPGKEQIKHDPFHSLWKSSDSLEWAAEQQACRFCSLCVRNTEYLQGYLSLNGKFPLLS